MITFDCSAKITTAAICRSSRSEFAFIKMTS